MFLPGGSHDITVRRNKQDAGIATGTNGSIKNGPIMSAAALHNNIGALLKRRGEDAAATKHFYDAISAAASHTAVSSNGGLTWFHRKLLAEQHQQKQQHHGGVSSRRVLRAGSIRSVLPEQDGEDERKLAPSYSRSQKFSQQQNSGFSSSFSSIIPIQPAAARRTQSVGDTLAPLSAPTRRSLRTMPTASAERFMPMSPMLSQQVGEVRQGKGDDSLRHGKDNDDNDEDRTAPSLPAAPFRRRRLQRKVSDSDLCVPPPPLPPPTALQRSRTEAEDDSRHSISVGMRGSMTPAGTKSLFVLPPSAAAGLLQPPSISLSARSTSERHVATGGGGATPAGPNRRGSLLLPSTGSRRRGSLVPLELRRGSSIGSHVLNRRSSGVLAAKKSEPSSSLRTSCDDGWTPLGLEFFDEPITVSSGNTNAEDAASAAWLNLAALRYKDHTQNGPVASGTGICESKILQEVMSLLGNCKTTTPFFAAARDSNEGVVLFRMNKTKDALTRFQKANELLDFKIPLEDAGAAESLYLRMAALLNHARTLVRVNDTTAALERCSDVAALSTEFAQKVTQQHASATGHAIVSNNITPEIQNQVRWLSLVAKYYVMGMIHQRKGELSTALECYVTFLNKARHDLGHNHLHVASVLFMKGMVLFEQRKLHHAMLAQLACLRIHESLEQPPDPREMAKVMYAIGRTLHDREEYRDALRMYQRTLAIQKQLSPVGGVSIPAVTTMCNIARVHHIMGDVDAALRENEAIVKLAERLAQGKPHPFWADRLIVLGNIYTEVGRFDKAMEVYEEAVNKAGGGDQLLVRSSPLDVDARLAASLAKAGLQHPGAAAA